MKTIGKWKWIIVLIAAVCMAMVGAAFQQQVWGLLLLIVGIYGCGYASGRLDEITGPMTMTIQLGFHQGKPFIRYIKEGDTKQS